MIKIAVVAETNAAREFLERRVGGILKNIGIVRALTEPELSRHHFDLIVVHHLGGRIRELQAKFKRTPVAAVDLSLLPIGVKAIMTIIRQHDTIAVVAEHQSCANKLLSEVIEAGIVNCKFVSGIFRDISELKADRYITSEEMSDGIPDFLKNDPRMVVVPRMINQESSVKLIQLALEIATRNRGVDAIVSI